MLLKSGILGLLFSAMVVMGLRVRVPSSRLRFQDLSPLVIPKAQPKSLAETELS